MKNYITTVIDLRRYISSCLEQWEVQDGDTMEAMIQRGVENIKRPDGWKWGDEIWEISSDELTSAVYPGDNK